ncbi:hypothetical protein EYC80_001707 [Monilinia laxa]|uniref:Uncharacterized protein n=1 Tax=Monilinia laxa TaxID=61186 RepID=A0A5N6K5Q8_MONLA|nr:hypothetical protein EYC80_001707 [Monilinia laxa]
MATPLNFHRHRSPRTSEKRKGFRHTLQHQALNKPGVFLEDVKHQSFFDKSSYTLSFLLNPNSLECSHSSTTQMTKSPELSILSIPIH